MTQQEAISDATVIAQKQNIEMVVYRSPAGLGEQEGFDDPWGYCPKPYLKTLGKNREKQHDIIITPK